MIVFKKSDVYHQGNVPPSLQGNYPQNYSPDDVTREKLLVKQWLIEIKTFYDMK